MIGHTQPRRIAAQAVASRLAAELDVRLGEAVGLTVRFTDQTSPAALVKVTRWRLGDGSEFRPGQAGYEHFRGDFGR